MNAFVTDEEFSGNPAYACFLTCAPQNSSRLQVLAKEFGRTAAFLWEDQGKFCIRWFTPSSELELCGHGTFAAGQMLVEEGILKPEMSIELFPRSGMSLIVHCTPQRLIELTMQAFPPAMLSAVTENCTDSAQDIHCALEVVAAFAYVGVSSRNIILVELHSEAELLALAPDIDAIHGLDCEGIIVTSLPAKPRSAANPRGCDFVSRYFCPRHGVDEDPATGSAHCTLAPYWAARLHCEGKQMVAHQLSERGGRLIVKSDPPYVTISGNVQTFIKGDLTAATA